MYNYLLIAQAVSNPNVLENSFSFTCYNITVKSNIITAKCLDVNKIPENQFRWKQCSSDIKYRRNSSMPRGLSTRGES